MNAVNRIDKLKNQANIKCIKAKNKAVQVCRVCGCTWDNACPGGCYWVEDDLCSQCADTDHGDRK